MNCFNTDSVNDLCKRYPKIDRQIISDIFLCGYNNYKAHINDKLLDVLRRSDKNKKIFNLVMDIFKDDILFPAFTKTIQG